jgi:hypothetical protein
MLLRCLTQWLSRSQGQTASTWWSVMSGGERYVIHATEWHNGCFRSVTPAEVYVFHEITGGTPNARAQALEDMSEQEFTSWIANGMAQRLGGLK